MAYQGVDSIYLRHMIYESLKHGRMKGNALMLVGPKDTGKTTVIQPAAKIYHCMDTPQSDSFCPLQDIRGHELFLWQDLRYNPGHPHKEEQGLRIDEGTFNRFLEGLPVRIGVAKVDGRSDFVYTEDAAFLFTGPYKFVAYRNGFPDAKETEQLDARVQYVLFARPAPTQLDRSFQPCALCWSQWVLEGELAWERARGLQLDEVIAKFAVNAATPSAAAPTFAAGPVAPVSAAPPAPQGAHLASPRRSHRLPPRLVCLGGPSG